MVKNELISVLKLLLENKKETFTIREISLKREINYKSAWEVIKKLQKENAITVTKKGNTKLCQIKQEFTNITYLAEKQRLKELLKDKNIKVIYNELYKINEQFITLLFGSYAKKEQTINSDMDLLIISNNSEKIAQKLDWIPRPIHVTNITYEQFIEGTQSKKFGVISEAINNNLILFGIEDYYKLLKNANS